MKKEWKTLYCDVDNLEENLNWLERKGFEVYEVYQATETGYTEADGSNFLVVASRQTTNRMIPLTLKKESTNGTVSRKSGGGEVQAKIQQKNNTQQKISVLKGKTCK